MNEFKKPERIINQRAVLVFNRYDLDDLSLDAAIKYLQDLKTKFSQDYSFRRSQSKTGKTRARRNRKAKTTSKEVSRGIKWERRILAKLRSGCNLEIAG